MTMHTHGAVTKIRLQMPIRDGYSATHAIRTDFDAPDVRNVPIIAMTASAIQGDKEKCQRAGMDVSGGPGLGSELLIITGLLSEACQG